MHGRARVLRVRANIAGLSTHLNVQYSPLAWSRLNGAFPRRAVRGARRTGERGFSTCAQVRANHAPTEDGREWLPVVDFGWQSLVSCQRRHDDQHQPGRLDSRCLERT